MDAVLFAFKKSAELAVVVKDKMRTTDKRSNITQAEMLKQLGKLSKKERQLTGQKVRLFEDFAGGTITKEQYIEAKSAISAELEKTKQRKAEIESKVQSSEPVSETGNVIGLLEKLADIQEVTPELVSFVKRIDVFDSERIEIQFTFADELARLCAFARN